MPKLDCEALHARAAMLHTEAELGRAKALVFGPDWPSYADQISIAQRCETMAAIVEEKVAEDC